jgi:hypothetical protein
MAQASREVTQRKGVQLDGLPPEDVARVMRSCGFRILQAARS